ncbi:lyase family protein [Roseateles sp. BYS180W]|uniref:Lyase family protein n=1 Tax=Roseateles rivi TaxID=3299028 RepID=A0ABW7FYN5_9BURK
MNAIPLSPRPQTADGLLGQSAVAQAMLDVLAALARVQARAGVIPRSAAQSIAGMCRVELHELRDVFALQRGEGGAAQALARQLQDSVALFDAAAAAYVGQGLTPQDLADTALLLLSRRALEPIDADLLHLLGLLLALAEKHGGVPLQRRAVLQPSSVISLRARLLDWALPLMRNLQALRQQAAAALVLQWTGPAVAAQAAAAQAGALPRMVAQELRLGWADAGSSRQRDRLMRLGAELCLTALQLGKLGQDLALLAQPAVGELVLASEQALQRCASVHAAAMQAPHRLAALHSSSIWVLEGGLGQVQVEMNEWLGLLTAVCSGCRHMALVVGELQPQVERMRDPLSPAPCTEVQPEPSDKSLPAAWLQEFDAEAQARQADVRVAATLTQARLAWQKLCAAPTV